MLGRSCFFGFGGSIGEGDLFLSYSYVRLLP